MVSAWAYRRARCFVAVLALLFCLAVPRVASAYSWMIREGYSTCSNCHVDPSGAGLLTSFGREEGNRLLTTRYSSTPYDATSKTGNFLWNAFDTPSWLLLGGSSRTSIVATKVESGPMATSLLIMQADLRAGVAVGNFRASASAGFVSTDKSLASIAGPVVSREHWLGYLFDDDLVLVRAGRMNLPFGVRSIEHLLWVRHQTRTDVNDSQQHGVAVAFSGDHIRAELMALLGNYQISPDRFRDRGYSGTIEYSPITPFAIGLSSMVTHSADDIQLRVADTRQSHGMFMRTSPVHPVVILAETDLVLERPKGGPASNGFAGMVQVDVEPVQGIHLIATGETWTPGGTETRASFGEWGAIGWFFLPHADVRLDVVHRSSELGNKTTESMTYLAQLHLYL